MTYPVAVHLEGKTCLVVGGGNVAARKVAGLLQAGGQVIVVSPTLHENISTSQIEYISTRYESRYLTEFAPFLVFAATDDPQVNRAVVQDARAQRIPVNVVDRSEASDFSNMTCLDKEPIIIAIATDGISPVLGQHLRGVIDDVVADHYVTLAGWLRELRPQVTANISQQSRRRVFWQQVMTSDVLSSLESGDTNTAHQHLLNLYQQAVEDAAL